MLNKSQHNCGKCYHNINKHNLVKRTFLDMDFKRCLKMLDNNMRLEFAFILEFNERRIRCV